jgi:hypothetical protein
MTSWDRRALVTALSAVLFAPWRVQAATVSDSGGRAVDGASVEKLTDAATGHAAFLPG